MQVRGLGPQDAALWHSLRLEALATYPNAFLTTYDEAAQRPLADVARRLEAGHTFGAFDGDDLVGIASLVPQSRAQTRHRGEISAFFVQPNAQGTGAASALMQAMIAAGLGIGVWQLELYVAASNTRAIAFYARHGFVEVGRLPNATVNAAGTEIDVIMVRTDR